MLLPHWVSKTFAAAEKSWNRLSGTCANLPSSRCESRLRTAMPGLDLGLFAPALSWRVGLTQGAGGACALS